jgi:hypothetical protein
VEERWHLLSELTRNERRERHLALHAAMLHRRLARLEAVAIDQGVLWGGRGDEPLAGPVKRPVVLEEASQNIPTFLLTWSAPTWQ